MVYCRGTLRPITRPPSASSARRGVVRIVPTVTSRARARFERRSDGGPCWLVQDHQLAPDTLRTGNALRAGQKGQKLREFQSHRSIDPRCYDRHGAARSCGSILGGVSALPLRPRCFLSAGLAVHIPGRWSPPGRTVSARDPTSSRVIRARGFWTRGWVTPERASATLQAIS